MEVAAAVQASVLQGKGPDMDPKVSALERAFQLAGSGQVVTVDDIKKRLKVEGYEQSVVDGGPLLGAQLRARIKTATGRPRSLNDLK